jgi:8-oxo-dGTP diphosphatase
MKSNLTTLCYIEKNSSYLMLHRTIKKNDINKDKWIGVGGHFETGESPEDCLLREVREETGLTLTSFRFRGLITFLSDNDPAEYMCLYTADGFTGTVTACDEGHLEWVEKEQVWNLNLWEGDMIFLKLLADEAPFFSLKLIYRNGRLVTRILDGKPIC